MLKGLVRLVTPNEAMLTREMASIAQLFEDENAEPDLFSSKWLHPQNDCRFSRQERGTVSPTGCRTGHGEVVLTDETATWFLCQTRLDEATIQYIGRTSMIRSIIMFRNLVVKPVCSPVYQRCKVPLNTKQF